MSQYASPTSTFEASERACLDAPESSQSGMLSLLHEDLVFGSPDQTSVDLFGLVDWNGVLMDFDPALLTTQQHAIVWPSPWFACSDNLDSPGSEPLDLSHAYSIAQSAPCVSKPRPPRKGTQSKLACPENGCGKSFMYPSLLAEHMRSHSGERPFICKDCGKSYTTNNRLKVHTRTHTNEKPYICNYEGCDFRTKQASDLKDHSIRHLSVEDRSRLEKKRKMIPCHECSRRFRTEAGLAGHKEKMPVCFVEKRNKRSNREDSCDSVTTALVVTWLEKVQMQRLASSIDDIWTSEDYALLPLLTDEAIVGNTACNETAMPDWIMRSLEPVHDLLRQQVTFWDPIWTTEVTSQAWETVIAHHSGTTSPQTPVLDTYAPPPATPAIAKKRRAFKNNFPCPECSKAFHFPSLLQEHLRTHSGERPFACSECDKSYTTKNRLKVRCHSNEKPYRCMHAGCKYSAKQASDLKHHSITHLPPDEKERVMENVRRNYPCVDCNRRFRTEAGLSRHKQAAPVCFAGRGDEGSDQL
ncbi:hypothetical protein HDU78_005087 [Chytriomyces hyalinus]|nr:hypothetical protein HDU78_005087 [Chytriomyces hyalinus]